MGGKDWNNDELNLLQNYTAVSYPELLRLFPGRTLEAIRIKATRLGIVRDEQNPPKYKCKNDFFTIPNLLNSYWAGFIAADGSVSPKEGLSIGISVKDISHLEQFKRDIAFEGPIHIRQPETKKIIRKTYTCASICKLKIHSKTILKDLETNFNIVQNKTLIYKPPVLTRENKLAFIVGLIDGDGCIYLNPCRGYPHISIVGTEGVCALIKQTVDEIAPTKFITANYHKIKEAQAFHYAFGSARVMTFYDAIKNLDIPKLERKWSIVANYKKNPIDGRSNRPIRGPYGPRKPKINLDNLDIK